MPPEQERVSHGVFYYVFWGFSSLVVTVFILGGSCLAIVVMAPIFFSSKTETVSGYNTTNKTKTIISTDEITQSSVDEENYIQEHIQLYEFSAKYHNTYDGKMAGVTFKMKNNGERILSEVAVTVYFPNASGEDVSEEVFYPVLSRSIYGDSKPLKPGYIWQLDGEKFYPAKNVPSEWYPPRTHYKITNIKFANDSTK